MRYTAKFLATTAMLLMAAASFAQNKITGTFLDKTNRDPLSFATVSLTAPGAKSAAKYVLTTVDGKFEIAGVRKGDYTIKVELMGYKAWTKDIKLEKSMEMGEILVDPDQQVLDAAKITDVGNPIVVKKDTVEYNASSFKTSDNDMLIDLLKKLPGIEVESDGSITANGETIKKITIDGKTFFLDDPQLASKNIPSKIVEKVKVVEKKSDQALFTGIDDGEEETIIDLGIKKGMMKGWFGNIMGGGGHDIPSARNNMNDWRYQGAGFVGNFTDKSQISVILNGNNTNNRGFNDMAAGMMGNMRGGGGRGMGRNGNDSGITTSWMGGVNGAWNLLDDRMELAGNYLYGGSNKTLEEEQMKNTYVSDRETLNYHNYGTNLSNSNGHRFGIRLDHKFSKNTSLLFEPQFNFGNGNFNEYSNFDTQKNYDGTVSDVNHGFTNTNGANRNWTASGFGLLRQRLGKPGRTITLNLRYNFSNNDLLGQNQSKTQATDTLERVNQRYEQNSKNMQLSGEVTYTEPLWTDWYLEANYRFSWRQQNSYKNVWDSGVYDYSGNNFIYNYSGETRNDDYSNTILNVSRTHRAGANIMYQKEKVRAQLGFSANPTSTYNYTSTRKDPYKSNVVNWAPQASLSYDFTDNSNIRLYYRGMENQPSTSQLMPVPDNSDPLNVSLGNPELKPYFSHSLRSNFRYTNKKNFMSVNASVDGSLVKDPIVNTTWYDKTGTQFAFPTNGPSQGNVGVRIMFNSPIAKSKFSVFNMLNVRYSNTSNYIAQQSLDMSRYYIDGDKNNFDYDTFLRDYGNLSDHPDEFSINKTQNANIMERIRFTYRSDLVELTLGGRTRMSKGWYSVSKGNTNTTWSNQVDASMNWTIPGGVNIISDFNYNWYRGYTTAQQSTAILNAEITKLLFKDKVTLALKGYDLLAQARNLAVSDTANYHQETRNNTLGRYVILSITYRFGNFGDMRGHGGPGGRGGHGGPGGYGGRGGYGGGHGGYRR